LAEEGSSWIIICAHVKVLESIELSEVTVLMRAIADRIEDALRTRDDDGDL